MRTNGFAIAAMVFLLLGIYLLNMSKFRNKPDQYRGGFNTN